MEKNQDERREQEIVYSRAIKAGKRIYYLDVRKARNNDLYLSITESKRRQAEGEEAPSFAHFLEGLQDVIGYVQNELGEIAEREEYVPEQQADADAEAAANEEGGKRKGIFGIFK